MWVGHVVGEKVQVIVLRRRARVAVEVRVKRRVVIKTVGAGRVGEGARGVGQEMKVSVLRARERGGLVAVGVVVQHVSWREVHALVHSVGAQAPHPRLLTLLARHGAALPPPSPHVAALTPPSPHVAGGFVRLVA